VSKKREKPPASPFGALRELRDKMAREAKDAEEAAKKKPSGAGKPAPLPARPKAPTAKTAAASADDELAFHRLMSGVTPLDDKKTRVAKTDVERAAPRARSARAPDETMEHLRVLIEEGSKFEVTDDGRRVEGHRVDVPPDFVRRLRRGGFPVDGSLDLHGKTAGEAKEAIAEFLRDKRARGERCVLIIHGKGEHSPGPAVLRGEISAWLSQGAASNHVAAFATAMDEDGGSGAVYVLLRR